MSKIEFIDLKKQYDLLKYKIDTNIKNVISSTQFIGGTYVKEIEKELAKFVHRKHCITCANGTDALQIAFMVYGIRKGDAVFCTDVTFVSSTEPSKMLGATSVFCDCTTDTYNIDLKSLRRQIEFVKKEGKLTPRAIVAVDILGNPADYDGLNEISKEYGLILIEDAAQSFGASYKGKRCCSFGDISTTSFFPAKPLGCYGDGGAIFTDDDEIAEKCRQIANHGKGPRGKYDNVVVGMNSRLDAIQAAILLPKLKALEEYEIEKRQEVAMKYNNAFSHYFVTPFVEKGCISVYAQYALLAKNTEERDKIIMHLKEKNIPSIIYYPTPQHLLPVFKDEPCYGEKFANAKEYCSRTFSLPMHPYLSDTDQRLVIETVLEAI